MITFIAIASAINLIYIGLISYVAMKQAKKEIKAKPVAHVEHRLMRISDMPAEDRAMLMRALSGQTPDQN